MVVCTSVGTTVALQRPGQGRILARSKGSSESKKSSSRYRLKPAAPIDYLDIAEVHCASFYGRVGPLWDVLLRMDRLMSLQQVEIASEHQQKQACITAVDTMNQPGTLPKSGNVLLDAVYAWMLGKMQPGSESSKPEGKVIGAVVVDTHMAFIPSRSLLSFSRLSLPPRKRMAYLSNLAVCPTQRRCGIGMELVHAAEECAKQWSCRSIALHVDPTNTAAYNLYSRLGYRKVAIQPQWQSKLEGRTNPLMLMLKRLDVVD